MRTPTLAQVLAQATEAATRSLRVSLPARIESFDPVTQLAKVKPLLRETFLDEEGSEQAETLPVISDVPVQFPGGGGYVVTFPVEAGDPCWLVFADRALDKWLGDGGDVDPVDLRRHDLADPVAMLGVRSKAGALAEFDAAAAVLGKVGGLRVRVTDSAVHLGVGHGEDANDAVALASKVDAQLAQIRNLLLTWVVVPTDGGLALKTAAGLLWVAPGPPPSSTASAVVKSK